MARTASPRVQSVCSFTKKARLRSSSESVSFSLHTEKTGLHKTPSVRGLSRSSVTTARLFLFDVPNGTLTKEPRQTDPLSSDGM